MRRRTFLTHSLLAAGTATSPATQPAPSPPASPPPAPIPVPIPVIDCHTHFYDPRRPEGIPWPAKDTPLYRPVLPEHLRAQPRHQPLTGTLVVEASSRLEDNDWLLQLAQADPFLVGIIGRFTATASPLSDDFRSQVRRYAANPLFRGIRVGSNAIQECLARSDWAALRLLADHNLVLDVNGGPDTPGLIAAAAGNVPQLRWILNHIGNVRITADAPPADWQSGIQAAARHPNVFCKVSALVEGAARDGSKAPDDPEFYRPYQDVVWNAFGEERVIYGSNWPVCERAADYRTVQRLALEDAAARSPTALARFCHLNARTVYAWPERKSSQP
ncbi:MAG: amidohydrolase family protein [Planctomycetota bacterium]